MSETTNPLLAAADARARRAMVVRELTQPEDELYGDAVRTVSEFGMASTSMLQRNLRIDYSRASRLIERMEGDGFIGPFNAGKPRVVLAAAERFVRS